MATLIPLTHGFFAIGDDADALTILEHKWHVFKGGYPVRSLYKDPSGKHKEFLHNAIMKPPLGLTVDHIDGNKLNNQRSNLRICSHAQNSRNRKRGKNNTSGYKGVSLHKKTGKWSAQIQLGLHNSKEEAAKAFDIAARQLFGEYASLNFPLEVAVSTLEDSQAQGPPHFDDLISVINNISDPIQG